MIGISIRINTYCILKMLFWNKNCFVKKLHVYITCIWNEFLRTDLAFNFCICNSIQFNPIQSNLIQFNSIYLLRAAQQILAEFAAGTAKHALREKAVIETSCFGGYGCITPTRGQQLDQVVSWLRRIGNYLLCSCDGAGNGFW